MLIIEHWGAVEADLSTYHRVADPLALPWRRLSTLVQHLPAGGAFLRAVAPLVKDAAPQSSTVEASPAPDEVAPEWLREYNRIHKIQATYSDLDLLRGGALTGKGW